MYLQNMVVCGVSDRQFSTSVACLLLGKLVLHRQNGRPQDRPMVFLIEMELFSAEPLQTNGWP